MVSLPVELSLDDWKGMLERFIREQGKRQAKTQREYLCKLGEEERGFTADEFKAAQTQGWEKQYNI